tara:strand:+ start:385 stop:531 length:147 start_codon:yes stop_codon:yes gene_type:complete
MHLFILIYIKSSLEISFNKRKKVSKNATYLAIGLNVVKIQHIEKKAML